MFIIEFSPLARSAIDEFLERRSVFGVGSLFYQVNAGPDPRFVAEYPKGLARPVDVPAGNIPAETAGVAQPLRFGQISFTSPQRLFRAAEFGSFPGFPQRPPHGGYDSRKPRLENIVRRADIQGFNGHFFAQGPGHEDERHVRPALPGDLQRRQTIERGKSIVRENQVAAAQSSDAMKSASLSTRVTWQLNALGLERFLN